MPDNRPDSARRARVVSIDVLRGIVMILMALDHVREFFGYAGDPTNPATTTAALFFTRWVTHFCAPVFFLLTGMGASLRRTPHLSRYLARRGLWLIALDLVVIRLAFQFNIDYRVTMVTVLWALGWAMIALAALRALPTAAVAAIGVTMIATHNLFDAVRPAAFGRLAPLWTILHVPGVALATPRVVVFAAYPLIPWIGVTAVGFALGQIYSWDPPRRRAFLLRAGVATTVAFVALRAVNVYGDPSRWRQQATAVRTVLSFLNATKYPPSLVFLLMTLGPALCVLAALDGITPRVLRPALVFGRVPLFYYVAHLPLIHALAVAVCAVRYGSAHWFFESPTLDRFPFTRPPGWGFGLPVVYALTALVVVTLYPACRRLWHNPAA